MTDFSLNSAQIKGLAGLFFNLATGLILGGLGLAIAGRLEEKIFASTFAFMVSIALVKAGLEFLEGVKE